MIPNRLKRVNHLLQNEISKIIRESVKDPRVGFASVTDVVAAADLRTARIYVSVLGSDEEQQAALAGLRKASEYIRARLRESITLRHIPQLNFHLDHSIERGVRVSMLIDEVAASGKAPEDDGEAGGGDK